MLQSITKRLFAVTAVLTLFFVGTSFTGRGENDEVKAENTPVKSSLAVYEKLNLKGLGLNQQAYLLALKGWEKLKKSGEVTTDIISICDFTQSSNNKRLYVINLKTETLLFHTLVAHGRNTGEEYASSFSNVPSSYKSSLGFYITKGTYQGKHGLSLKLCGKENGINDNAEERAIVMHGADYVCHDFIQKIGRLGRSFGCPSVPYGEHEKIIKTIKDGTCLFIYYPDKSYLSASTFLH